MLSTADTSFSKWILQGKGNAQAKADFSDWAKCIIFNL